MGMNIIILLFLSWLNLKLSRGTPRIRQRKERLIVIFLVVESFIIACNSLTESNQTQKTC